MFSIGCEPRKWRFYRYTHLVRERAYRWFGNSHYRLEEPFLPVTHQKLSYARNVTRPERPFIVAALDAKPYSMQERWRPINLMCKSGGGPHHRTSACASPKPCWEKSNANWYGYAATEVAAIL